MRIATSWALVLLIAACTAAPPGPTEPGAPSPSIPAAVVTVPRCDDVPGIEAAPDMYRDEPIYVGNEMPSEELQRWAQGKPGFEVLWIDRDHHGWVTLAFSSGADARQQELEADFPGVGAVVVSVDWTIEDLEALEARARAELPEVVLGTSTSVTQGVATLFIGAFSDERIGAVNERFAGERVCITGVDPAAIPSDGPQPQSGEGWRLLGEGDGIGPVHETGIAWDDESYANLWRRSQLMGEPPVVDFETEVVLLFGVVTGSLCPPIRMDNVLVSRAPAVIYPEIVHLGFGACTSDIHQRPFVVAFERARLPRPPFRIGLSAELGPGSRTRVEADLSVPGSVPQPGEVRNNEPSSPHISGPGAIVETGYEFDYRQSAGCGLEWLGPINDLFWRTAEGSGPDWLPDRWAPALEAGQLTLSVIIREGNPPRLFATAEGTR